MNKSGPNKTLFIKTDSCLDLTYTLYFSKP
jgi:hypothetical protein